MLSVEEREGYNKTEAEALVMRLERLLADPEVSVVKVKLAYQERSRPNRYDGRTYEILNDT